MSTGWVRDVAADRWDSALAPHGFRRTGVTYSRKIPGGRQRLHPALIRHGGLRLSLRASVAFPAVAREVAALTDSPVAKSDIVDMALLDTLAGDPPWLSFGSADELAGLEVERYLLDPLVPWLDRRMSVAALVAAQRAEIRVEPYNGWVGQLPMVVAAGLLVLDDPEEALRVVESAYPVGVRDREAYAAGLARLESQAGRPADRVGRFGRPQRRPGPGRSASADAGRTGRSATPSATYRLKARTTLSLPPVVDPGPEQLARVVHRLDEERFFAVLERSDGVYAQVGFGPKAGAAAGVYALEHRDSDAHLRAETPDRDEAVRFLHRFRAGDDWRAGHAWQTLHL
ncbi:hypothetical protein ACQP2F_04325 [Actinoplanes sp. CA-030573]|uniref:hypothetical protein n=1 Tax=Actinoplanes sp. CA-030573 TaxID=3239898 RepID=UPI003D8CBE8D